MARTATQPSHSEPRADTPAAHASSSSANATPAKVDPTRTRRVEVAPAPNERIGSSNGSDRSDAASEMFITPRVIDHNLFRRYGESLQKIIREAGGVARALSDQAASVEVSRQSASEALASLTPKVEISARLVSSMDQRAGQLRSLLDATADTDAHRQKLEAAVQQATDALIAQAVKRVQEATNGCADRLRSMAEEAIKLETRLERASTTVADAERRAETAEKRATEAERLAKEATERLDAAEKSLAEIGPAAAGKLDDAESRMSELESRIEAALVRATEAPEGLEERVEKAIKEAREAPEKIAAEFTETTEAFQQRAGEIAERMEAASEACERFETLLERVNKLRKDEAGIETLVSRVSSAECRMNEVMGDLRSLSEQGEEARRILSDALLEAVDHIDRLEEQRSDLVASIAETCRQTELRVPSLADAVDEISRELDALDARKSQVHSGVSAEVTEGLQRVEQAGAWLAQLIKRAEKAAASMEGSED